VSPHIRRFVTFRQANLHEPWPIRQDVRFDLIFCRNVLIYFDKATQRKLLERFATKLRPGGYLFLGHSENTLGLTERFIPIGQTMYRLPESGREAA
jgi:chemotaxis protein methyltransferase CheR